MTTTNASQSAHGPKKTCSRPSASGRKTAIGGLTELCLNGEWYRLVHFILRRVCGDGRNASTCRLTRCSEHGCLRAAQPEEGAWPSVRGAGRSKLAACPARRRTRRSGTSRPSVQAGVRCAGRSSSSSSRAHQFPIDLLCPCSASGLSRRPLWLAAPRGSLAPKTTPND